MFEELTLVQMASSMARNATVRQKIVAENIANADTPGYRARDVKGFAEYVKESFTARATRPEHVGSQAIGRAARAPEVYFDQTVQASANGNNVSLEDEIVRSVETRGQHAMALAVYGKTAQLMRLSLGRR